VWTKDADEHFIPVIYIDLLQKGKGPLKCSHPQSKAEFTILRLDLLPPFGSSQKVVASFCYGKKYLDKTNELKRFDFPLQSGTRRTGHGTKVPV